VSAIWFGGAEKLSGKSANFAEELVKLSTDPNIVQTMRHMRGNGSNDQIRSRHG
jgi:hypothetical protein